MDFFGVTHKTYIYKLFHLAKIRAPPYSFGCEHLWNMLLSYESYACIRFVVCVLTVDVSWPTIPSLIGLTVTPVCGASQRFRCFTEPYPTSAEEFIRFC